MAQTIGYHVVKSAYGLWLPGDERGSWSSAWDDQIKHHEPHMLHTGDPVRERMALERMTHDPLVFTDDMISVIVEALRVCIERSKGGLSMAALAIEPTHMHMLIPYSGKDIHNTTKWIADQTTKRVRSACSHSVPVWCKGKWCGFIFDDANWESAKRYIERHNERRGLPPRPYDFITTM